MDSQQKTVLFYAINTPGHVNFLLALADKIKADHGYNTVFLLMGQTFDDSVEAHGHKMVIMEEENVLEEDEITEDEDLSEAAGAKREKAGKKKIKLTGYLKYEYFLRRQLGGVEVDPLERFELLMAGFRRLVHSEVINNHRILEDAIDSIKPDLVIADVFIVPPSILKLKVPWVKVCSANPLVLTKPKSSLGIKPPAMCGFKLLDKERRERLRKENPAEWESMVESWRSAMKRLESTFKEVKESALDKFYVEQGLPQLPKGIQGHDSPYLNLYLYPKEIDYDQDDDLLEYPAKYFRCDSMIRKPISQLKTDVSKFWIEKLEEGLKGKKEMVFFSLGSLASGNTKLMKKYVDVFKKDQERLYVFSKGVHGNKYELDSSNMIGGNYIPQTFFLERANLAIIHGGNNSVYECLYHGIPMIVLPVFGDQTDNAERIEDLGLGKRLKVFDVNEEKLLGAVNEILSDQSISKRTRIIGQQMRSRDTSTKVSLMLKKLMDEKDLDQSTIDMFKN